MSILNGYIPTYALPKASMIEGYYTEEAIESRGPFYNSILKDQVAIGLYLSRHEGRLYGSREWMEIFHPTRYNTGDTSQHPTSASDTNDWVMKQHKQQLNTWLMVKDIPHGETIEEQNKPSRVGILTIMLGPDVANLWHSGFTFCTKFKDKKSMSQNYSVRCEAIDDETGEIITYFGFLEDI
jgi:hypothetical protein